MTKTIIEINGVKMELDLRHARRIDELRVGDRVKVLLKTYSDYKVHAGTIIGFEPFKNLPTLIVAYIENGYNSADVKFVYFNSSSKDVEIVKAIDDDAIGIAKADVLTMFDRMIAAKQREIEDFASKKEYFLRNFQTYWEPVAKPREPEIVKEVGDE
jgi:hypothetical protein